MGVGCLLGLSLLAGPAAAQTLLGRISGCVIDPDSAVIPAADVEALNEETGVKNTVQSNETGSYTFPALNPGTYTVSATIPGFKTFQRSGIRLATAHVLELDITMELGAVTETSDGDGEAPRLESTTSTVGQMMETKTMEEMPLGARRSLNLVAMSGAAVFLQGGKRAKFSLAGGRVNNQSFIFDGGTMQNMRLGVGQARTDPPVSSIREFRVVQNSYATEYGGPASGVIVNTTKSGTNEFHGSAYEFFRNDKLDAADFLSPTEGDEKIKPVRRYHLFGEPLEARSACADRARRSTSQPERHEPTSSVTRICQGVNGPWSAGSTSMPSLVQPTTGSAIQAGASCGRTVA